MRTVRYRRGIALLLSLLLVLALAPTRGSAAPSGVYFTAANEQLLELTDDTMPFWSRGVLYISSRLFERTDLNVAYVRNSSMGMATLYTTRTDLRFDLKNSTVVDKNGISYKTHAIEKGGVVFFPLDMVCRHFGLNWNLMSSDTAPLIRLTNNEAMLSDREFLASADSLMRSRYTAYEKWLQEQEDPSVDWPPVQATGEQKVHLIVEHRSAEDTLALMEQLDGSQAAFLMTAEQMENGDLLRGMVARAHAVVLLATGETEEDLRREVNRARELLWQAACSWLGLIWYEGGADLASVLQDTGCIRVTASLDQREKPLTSTTRLRNLLRAIGLYRDDLSVLLGPDSSCVEHLPALLEELERAGFRVCAWRSHA